MLLECSTNLFTQLYVSTKHPYPYELEFKGAFGDLPAELIEKAKVYPLMRDLLTEASPYEIGPEGQIIYHR